MLTTDALVAVLEALTDAQRRDFAHWVDDSMVRSARRATESVHRAVWALERLGDGTLSEDMMRAIRYDPPTTPEAAAENGTFYNGEALVMALAEALDEHDEEAIEAMRPALDWLQSTARG